MWLPNILLDGKIMVDPIGKMIMDAVTAPYQKEEHALKMLLPSKKIERVPAATSEIIPLKIVWDKAGGLFVTEEEHITIMNPFQLMPNIKNNFISFIDKTASTTETNRMTKITGTWKTSMVGPLYGKPYAKEVPLVIDTMTRNFYTFTEDSTLFPYPILQDDTQAFSYLYNYINSKSGKASWKNPLYISMVQQFMQLVNLPDLPWYQSPHYTGYSPINWNPLSKNLSDVLGRHWWSDYVLDSPTELSLEQEKDKISSEEYLLNEGWGIAATNFRQLIDMWIEDALDEWFTHDEDGWGMEQGWDTALGYYILTAGQEYFGKDEKAMVHNMIDAVMGLEFSRMENKPTRQFLIDNKKKLQDFMDTDIMLWLFALQLPKDYGDYIQEWLHDYEE